MSTQADNALDEAALERLQTLLDAATPAPWEVVDYTRGDPERDTWLGIVKGAVEVAGEAVFQVARVKYSSLPEAENIANAALIVAMRNALPSLLASLRASRKDEARSNGDVRAAAGVDQEVSTATPAQDASPSHVGHGRTNYSCGHLAYQCRCIHADAETRTLDKKCPKCDVTHLATLEYQVAKARALCAELNGCICRLGTSTGAPDVDELRRRDELFMQLLNMSVESRSLGIRCDGCAQWMVECTCDPIASPPDCGYGCDMVWPYGWVPEACCPVHDPKEPTSSVPTSVVLAVDPSRSTPAVNALTPSASPSSEGESNAS